ncbi:cation:H+ antiporter [Nocardioides massiliensis]|uniref:Cation:H+ antiporter n=1 Tax=Nocardioides massiliensis TaxID=1325935 RepID=A0ABT9NLU0_9ACTN|nr:calcium/sodium antiporter [Nocardioides massiliensis]MDP9821010.1 cation:H+ antiporter [Nocardioides massiliensis]
MSVILLAGGVAGLVLLVVGGELLVRGGSALGVRLGLSPLVVGLTIVAFATSAPELAVSVGAALRDAPGLAVGNVVGSNIVNVLLVLGLAAVILPVAATSSLIRIDVPVLVAMSVLFLVLALDGSISTVDGMLLLAVLVLHTAWSVWSSRRQTRAPAVGPDAVAGSDVVPAEPRLGVPMAVLVIALGIAALLGGAELVVAAAREVATAFGLSDLVVGLTVVAIGTSLPELATSVIAAIRGEREIAIGNVVGSGIFNIGAVMGLTAIIAPSRVPVDPAAVNFDLPVMVLVAVVLLPLVFTGFEVARWEGVLLVAYFAAYVGYVLLDATGHDALPVLSGTLLWFALPLTLLLLVATTSYEVGRRRERAAARG